MINWDPELLRSARQVLALVGLPEVVGSGGVAALLEMGVQPLDLAYTVRDHQVGWMLDSTQTKVLVLKNGRWLTGLKSLGEGESKTWVDLQTGRMASEPDIARDDTVTTVLIELPGDRTN